jgi:hypothetical protein
MIKALIYIQIKLEKKKVRLQKKKSMIQIIGGRIRVLIGKKLNVILLDLKNG